MRTHCLIPTESIEPSRERVLALQGMPGDARVPDKVEDLFHHALEIFHQLARPIALLEAISGRACAELFFDDVQEAMGTPLPGIIKRSTRLALYAVTAGSDPEGRVDFLFSKGDLGLAVMLDAVSSAAMEMAAEFCASQLFDEVNDPLLCGDGVVLGYSPGYCGWPVTAQNRLWTRLRPDEIDNSLTASCMMGPRKSVSCILVG